MKLKMDEAGHVVVADGKPVYIFDDGKETPFDVADMYGKLSRDGKRNSELQKSVEAGELKLRAFEGIEDPDAARRALETLKNIDQGQLIAAGKVEEIKAAAKKASEDQVLALNKKFNDELTTTKSERDALKKALDDEKIGGSFSRSKFIADKVAVPTDMLEALFRRHFTVEDGKLLARDQNGTPIHKRSSPNEPADFDEALETLISAYPNRDAVLKGTGHSGSGARPGNGMGNHAGRTMTKAVFDALPPAQQASLMSSKDRPALVD